MGTREKTEKKKKGIKGEKKTWALTVSVRGASVMRAPGPRGTKGLQGEHCREEVGGGEGWGSSAHILSVGDQGKEG